MKTRLSAMAVAISSLSMLTACGNSPNSVGPGNFGPKVTVTAPRTSTPGAKISVAWTSTNAQSCTADFSSSTDTSGSVSITEDVQGTKTFTKTYTVTCTNTIGSASDSATVTFAPEATAQGAWTGTTGTGRAIAGVVTKEGKFWLAYSTAADASVPAGFYAGSGTSAGGDYPSQDLREFNFEGGGAMQGTLSATYTQSTGYTAANTLAGSFNAVSVGSVYNLTMSASSYFAGAQGDLNFVGFTGTYDSNSGKGSWTGTINSSDDPNHPSQTVIPFDFTFTQTFVMPTAVGPNDSYGYPTQGTLDQFDVPTCFDNLAQAYASSTCQGFSGPLSGPFFNTTAPNGVDNTGLDVPTAFTPSDGASLTWTLQVYLAGPHGTSVFTPVPMNVTLHAQSLPSIADDTFSSTYNAAYEETPSLTTVAGSYTSGSTGIDTAMNADASLTIDSSGAIVGTEATSHCDYTGTIAPHATPGNVYDVTLTFAGSNGSGGGAGGCVYDSETFTGVATAVVDTSVTPSVTKLTITAVNATNDQGFMVVATK